MGTKQSYLGNASGGNHTYLDTVNGPARGQSMWQSIPILPYYCDPSIGIHKKYEFDTDAFASNTIGGWTFTQATSGTIVSDTSNPNGVAVISAGATVANQGVNWQMTNGPLKIATGKDVAFSARVQFTGLSSLRLNFFLGLAAQSTALISGGSVASVDHIGFIGGTTGSTTAGLISSRTAVGGTGPTGTGVAAITNNTWYDFAFWATTTGVQFFVNGVVVQTLTTNIPTSVLAPIIVVQANGTVTPVVNLDYLAYWGGRN